MVGITQEVALRGKPRSPETGVSYGGEPALPDLEFPGCEPMRLPRDQLERFEGRLEFWDARAETAWVVREPTSPAHEYPSQALGALVQRIAAVRGSPIACYGSMDLMLRDSDGEPRRIMQADQSVYLYPERADLLGAIAMVVGEHEFPDVVLEVDHTTDVRRGKLKLYESWGFPEVWVEVPNRPAASRSRGRIPGLTIHLLQDRAYRESRESHAFPGWAAAEIHAALNETTMSVGTHRVLERAGATLGARDGTGPDDDPLLRSQRWQGFEKGRSQGYMEGRADTVRQIMLFRGIEVSTGFPANLPAFAELPEAVAVAAALASESEADFLLRIRQPRVSGDGGTRIADC